MSSLFEAPTHLVMMLASIVAGQEPAEPGGLDPARAVTAELGPYSFSETLWLDAVRKGFGGANLEPFRARIFATSNGRLYVPIPGEKSAILAARRNTFDARGAAIGLARYNAAQLRVRLGRPAGVRDLYAAHMLGLDLAAHLAGLKATNPNVQAATALPDFAALYPQAVVQRGVPLTIADVYRRLPDADVQNFAQGVPANRLSASHDRPDAAVASGAGSDRSVSMRGVINDDERVAFGSRERLLPAYVALEWTTHVQPSQ